MVVRSIYSAACDEVIDIDMTMLVSSHSYNEQDRV